MRDGAAGMEMIRNEKKKLEKRKDKKMKKKDIHVELESLEMEKIAINIKGLSSYIVSRKTKEDMEEVTNKEEKKKGLKKTKEKLEVISIIEKAHIIQRNGENFLDWKFGHPAEAFLKAMIESARHTNYKMSALRGCFRIKGILGEEGIYLVPFTEMDKIVIKDDFIVNEKTRGARLVQRPEFFGWACILNIFYYPKLISPNCIVDLLRIAGITNGIGAKSPRHKCCGEHGMWEII